MGFLPCITSMLLRRPCSCRQGSPLSDARLLCMGGGLAVSSSSQSEATPTWGRVLIGKRFGRNQQQ